MYLFKMEEETYQDEESITELLIRKEKELQTLGKLRIQQLQEQLLVKDQAILELQEKLRRINDDFQYNLQIIEQRDEELDVYDRSLQALREELTKKDKLVGELNGRIERADAKCREEHESAKPTDRVGMVDRDELWKLLEDATRTKDDELRRKDQELANYRHKMETMLASKHKEYTDTLGDLQRKFEERISQQLKHTSSTERIKELQTRLNELQAQYQAETYSHQTETRKLLAQIEDLQQNLTAKSSEAADMQSYLQTLRQAAAKAEKTVELSQHREVQAHVQKLQDALAELKTKHHAELDDLRNQSRRETSEKAQFHSQELHRLQRQLMEALEETREKTAIILDLEARLNSQEASYNDRFEEYQSAMLSIDRSWKETAAQLRIKEVESESVMKHVNYWKDQAETKADEISRLKLEISTRGNKIKEVEEALKRTKLDCINELKSLQSELTGKQTDYAMESRVKVLELENARLQAEICRQPISNMSRLSPHSSHSRRHSQSSRELDLTELNERIRRLEVANASLERELEGSRHNRFIAEGGDTRELLELKERQIQTLKSQLHNAFAKPQIREPHYFSDSEQNIDREVKAIPRARIKPPLSFTQPRHDPASLQLKIQMLKKDLDSKFIESLNETENL